MKISLLILVFFTASLKAMEPEQIEDGIVASVITMQKKAIEDDAIALAIVESQEAEIAKYVSIERNDKVIGFWSYRKVAISDENPLITGYALYNPEKQELAEFTKSSVWKNGLCKHSIYALSPSSQDIKKKNILRLLKYGFQIKIKRKVLDKYFEKVK